MDIEIPLNAAWDMYYVLETWGIRWEGDNLLLPNYDKPIQFSDVWDKLGKEVLNYKQTII